MTNEAERRHMVAHKYENVCKNNVICAFHNRVVSRWSRPGKSCKSKLGQEQRRLQSGCKVLHKAATNHDRSSLTRDAPFFGNFASVIATSAGTTLELAPRGGARAAVG